MFLDNNARIIEKKGKSRAKTIQKQNKRSHMNLKVDTALVSTNRFLRD